MGQSFIQVPVDSTGKKVDTQVTATAAQHRHAMVLADPSTDAAVAPVKNTDAASSDYGPVVRDVHTVNIDAATGTTADAAVTGDNTGTVSAKLRGLTKILADVWDSVNHWFKVSVQNATLAVTQSGNWTARVVGNAGGVVDAAGQNVASPANELLVGGQFNTTPTTISTGNMSPLQLTSAARLIVDGSQVTQPVSGTVTTTPPSNASTNVAQFGGTNVSTGTGAGGTGIPRVTVSNDSNVLATQSGTWTVQPGNTANTTPWLSQLQAGTAGGSTTSSTITSGAANQDSNNVKASAGLLYGWALYNTTTSIRYVKIYNKATAPTSADTPALRIALPGNTTGSGANVMTDVGAVFGTGLGFRVTTGAADSDTGAASANDVFVNLFYK